MDSIRFYGSQPGVWPLPKCTGTALEVCKQLCFMFSKGSPHLYVKEKEGKRGAWEGSGYRLWGKSGYGGPNSGAGICPWDFSFKLLTPQ